MKKKIILCLILLLTGVFSNAEPVKKPLNAVLYSAFIPGGGQIYNGKYIKAGIVVGVQSYLIGSAVYHHDKRSDYARRADQAISSTEIAAMESKRNEYRDLERNDYWWIGITAVLSIADAFVDAHLYDFEAQKEKVRLRFEDQQLQLEYRF